VTSSDQRIAEIQAYRRNGRELIDQWLEKRNGTISIARL
jgi:hypothetical protein